MSEISAIIEKDTVVNSKRTEQKKQFQTNTNQSSEQINHPQYQQLDLANEIKDRDSDSGIASVRHSREKVATSISRNNLALDDELENDVQLSPRTHSLTTTSDDRRGSDSSSITNFTINKTTSEFNLNLNSKTSSRASGMNLPPVIPSIPTKPSTNSSTKSSMPMATHTNDSKERTGVRKLMHKIFRGSPSSSSSSAAASPTSPTTTKKATTKTTAATTMGSPDGRRINLDLVNGTAYPALSPLPVTQGPIRLLVLRHGERLDRYYSSQWLRQAFDKDGNFCRFSPILPETLPFRASIRDFDLDPPLTYKGLKDAYHTGTVLKDKNIHINYCYSSPALRCVQTATKILEGLQVHNKIKIRLEPGLFECTGWYTASETSNVLTMPRFMTKKEYLENKYPINKQYHEQMTIAELSQLETELEFYQRSHAVTANILKMHENEYITQIQQGQATLHNQVHVLFIAHAPNLETCTRKLCGGKFRPDTLPHVIRNVDFLTMTVIEKTDNNCDKWIFRRSSFYGDEF